MLMDWLWMLLPGVVIMFVDPRLMRWIERSRLRVRPASEARSLVQPRGLLAIGFGFLVAAAVFGFALFDWLASRVIASRASRVSADKWTQPQQCVFKFSARRRLWLSPCPLVGTDPDVPLGEKVRISSMLMGLPEFARMLLSHAPRARVSSAAHTMLQELAQNKLRPLWP